MAIHLFHPSGTSPASRGGKILGGLVLRSLLLSGLHRLSYQNPHHLRHGPFFLRGDFLHEFSQVRLDPQGDMIRMLWFGSWFHFLKITHKIDLDKQASVDYLVLHGIQQGTY